MANRSSITSGFNILTPPWSLATLDGYLNTLNGVFNESSLGLVNTGTDTGSANNYSVPVLSYGSFSAYNQGATFVLIPANTNLGASTLSISGLGAVSIQDIYGNPLVGGALVAGQAHPMVYIGSVFRLLRNSAFVSYFTSHTPVFGVWNLISGWNGFIIGTPTSIATYNAGTSLFTLVSDCLVVLTIAVSAGNTAQAVALGSISGGLIGTSTQNLGVSSSGGSGAYSPTAFFAPAGSGFGVYDDYLVSGTGTNNSLAITFTPV